MAADFSCAIVGNILPFDHNNAVLLHMVERDDLNILERGWHHRAGGSAGPGGGWAREQGVSMGVASAGCGAVVGGLHGVWECGLVAAAIAAPDGLKGRSGGTGPAGKRMSRNARFGQARS